MKNKDMLFDKNLLIEVFVKSEDFCKTIEKELLVKMLKDPSDDYQYKKPSCEMTEKRDYDVVYFLSLSRLQVF